nr:3-hydroxybenzoate 4-monooxygenase [Quercus suber]
MQYHLNGVKAGGGDPLRHQFDGTVEPDFQSSLPTDVHVLIIGSGPAGLLLATQLSRFPDITTRIIDSRAGPLQQGQADGLQCRTIEIFEAFGFSEKVLKEAYWVNETTFWSPGEGGEGLARTGRIRDTEEGLSEFPHVILNQARMHDLWLESMKWSPTRLEPTYGRQMIGLKVPEDEDGMVEVEVERSDEGHRGETEVVRAKYVVGCDGARSTVRRALGLEMKGDFANQAWGVLDALVVTDFPDIRLKTAIHSAHEGSILIIPREGGYLVRFYIEMDKLKQDERIASKNITAETLIERATCIFAPFTFEVKEVAYWSVYEVGQRLTDHFDDVPEADRATRNPKVFIAGDACHTHSAKAGQGMNVSMNDAYNLGWKLAAVLRGNADPSLLRTYSQERHAIAQLLIDFDRQIAKLFAAKPRLTAKPIATNDDDDNAPDKSTDEIDPADFQDYFTRQGRFMAGVETRYCPSLITNSNTAHQALATGFQIGTRFHSCQVLRLSDAKPVHLGHTLTADGRWRILLFNASSSDPTSPASLLSQTCTFLHNTLLPRYTPSDKDIDSVLDVRCVLAPTASQSRQVVPITALPALLFPRKGRLGLQDHEKVFTDEASYGFGSGEIYRSRGIDAEKGCVLVVRPDQYVSAVLPLGGAAMESGLESLFAGFLRPASAQ